MIAMLVVLILGMTALLASSLNSSALKLRHEQNTFDALTRAREVLIGDTVAQMPVTSAGYLRLPDLGFKVGNVPSEGSAAPNFSGNGRNYSVAGKFPWRTLGLEPLRDGAGECLWYVVSGRFKNTPTTDVLNWDTQGQINLADGNGNIIARNAAALIIAPGRILDGQNRALSNPAYAQCGGNYDAQNYLDPYSVSDAVSGAVNYFGGSTNNRVASDTSDKLWLMAESVHYNDRFLPISSDDLFRILIRRSDFSVQVSALLDDAYFQGVSITGSKGTDSVNCNLLASNNRTFCKNWKEMLLLTALPVPSPVVIDGTPTANCTRVLLFGGHKNSSQLRLSITDKANPANYLEGINIAAFAAPLANAGSFSGASTFSANAADTDLLRCLP